MLSKDKITALKNAACLKPEEHGSIQYIFMVALLAEDADIAEYILQNYLDEEHFMAPLYERLKQDMSNGRLEVALAQARYNSTLVPDGHTIH